jgi:ABC-2 type transport system permease protein
MTPNPTGPIADLRYRNYDGKLLPQNQMWWVIARQSIAQALKKKSLWFLMAASGWYYIIMMIILFFVEQNASGSEMAKAAMDPILKGIIWKDQFLNGFVFAQLSLLLVTLMIGSGTIANDNRANALLVYLSKPCSKLDYLVGKWIGVFLPIFVLLGTPTLLFYVYGALTFSQYGFVSADPWILPKMVGVVAISAAIHSSLIVGVSSLFNQGRLAGATYAGIYFLSNFFTVLMSFFFQFSKGKAPDAVQYLTYASIDGIQTGIAKAILNTKGSPPFLIQPRNPAIPIPGPNLTVALLITALVCGVALFAAWRRVRAVEVIG